MQALMQDKPLLISSLIEHAATFHPETEIVTKTVEGPMHRTNYRELRNRSKQMANALKTLGVDFQDRVGTLAWNMGTISNIVVRLLISKASGATCIRECRTVERCP